MPKMHQYLKHVHMVSQRIIVTAVTTSKLTETTEKITAEAMGAMARDDRKIDTAALEKALADMTATMEEMEALREDAEASRAAALSKLDTLAAATSHS